MALLVGASWSHHGHKHVRKAPPCSLRGSKTIYRDTSVRVYTKDFPETASRDAEFDTFACLFAVNKRRFMVGDVGDFFAEWFLALTIRPPWIAYGDFGGSRYGNDFAKVCSLNLRTGARRCSPIGSYDPSTVRVNGIGLTRAGSVAWMQTDTVYNPPVVSVYERDAGRKKPVTLDSGTDIDRSSFAVGGRYIYWTKAGTPRSATMP